MPMMVGTLHGEKGPSMDTSPELIADAEAATGDTIVAVGRFQQKGASGSALGGFASGTGVGSAVGESFTGDGAGEAGDAAPFADAGEGLSPVVAVSESRIYVLRQEDDGLAVVHRFHRGVAHVSVHSRITVKTLEIEDPQTRQRVELEAERMWGKQAQGVINELLHDR
jgi:hypothetical protein